MGHTGLISKKLYNYTLDQNPSSLTMDGEISKEKLGAPFFDEYIRVGSGHPQGRTYGWVKNDESNLSVAIDFTPDNTMDGGKDYAAQVMYIGTEAPSTSQL